MLKRIFIISVILFGLTFTSFAQIKLTASPEPVAKLIKFYPNPATSAISFEFQRSYDKSYSLQLYNFMGKKVYEIKTVPQRINLSLAEFFRGVYIYQLRNKNGKILESGKFQVVK